MEVVKVSMSGMSTTYQFGEGEERKSLRMMAEYIGWQKMVALLHFIKAGGSEFQVRVFCGMQGVQGYPVDVFIDWAKVLFKGSLEANYVGTN